MRILVTRAGCGSHRSYPGSAQAHVSRTTVSGSMSSRRPLKAGWRSVASYVHSLNSTEQTSRGSQKRGFGRFGPTPSSKGLVSVASGSSRRSMSSMLRSESPLPTPPA